MARIFLGLAIVTFAMLAINILLGLWTDDYGDQVSTMLHRSLEIERLKREREVDTAKIQQLEQQRAAALHAAAALRTRLTLHTFYMGIASALMTVFVNSLSMTYFIGTSRWCLEVVETYRLDGALAAAAQRLKRRTFPWAFAGMMTILGIIALGALSDPSVSSSPSQPALHLSWRQWHFFAAVLGTMFIGYSFWRQTQAVRENYQLIEKILAEVQRIRAARGLDTAAEPSLSK